MLFDPEGVQLKVNGCRTVSAQLVTQNEYLIAPRRVGHVDGGLLIEEIRDVRVDVTIASSSRFHGSPS